MSDERRAIETGAVQGTAERGEGRDIVAPLHPSTTWRFETMGELEAHLAGEQSRLEYARYGSPTVRAVEERLAFLEGGDDALLFGSGMAALTTALLGLLGQGKHVIFTGDGYRPSRMLAGQVLSRFGVTFDVIPVDAPERIAEVGRPGETRVVFTELPTNPHLHLPDLAAFREAMKPLRGARLVVDATLATPWNCQPLALGADLVMHSVTKFIAGHNDVTSGALVGKAGMIEALREVRGLTGAIADPHGAWLVHRGLRSFPVRMERHNRSALELAGRLADHRMVETVFHPGLHAPLPEGMRGGGGVVSFVVRGGRAAAARMIDGCSLIQHAASLGGAESLIQQPAVFSWHDLDDEQLAREGIEPGLVRLSVGLENVDDLWADLASALSGAGD